jgi:hypothetical protein
MSSKQLCRPTDTLNFYSCISHISTNYYGRNIHAFFITLFFLSLLVIDLPVQASSNVDPEVERANLAIHKKLDFYNQAFPDIQFAHLQRSGEWYESIQALELLLGYQATSLDFQHPQELREDLLFATVRKIGMMLINGMTSSYLFRVGQMPVAKKKHVCVITLDPESTIISNRIATEYFIDLPLDQVEASRFIDKDKHLDFIIDHEAYHCLDTYYYGGIPMSHRNFSTRHEVYRRENEADMFALAMHIKRDKGITDYAKKIIQLRGMSLLNGELQHYSADVMNKVRNYNQKTIIRATAEELLRLIKQLHKPLALSFQQYLQYRTNAVAAIRTLGRQVNEMDKPVVADDLSPEKEKVHLLIQQTKNYYKAFFGHAYPASE